VVCEEAGICKGLAESIVNEEDGTVRIGACYVSVVACELGNVACRCAFPFEAFEATGLKSICHSEENQRVRKSREFCSVRCSLVFGKSQGAQIQLYDIFAGDRAVSTNISKQCFHRKWLEV
jgi:hypothetical protein